MGRSRRYRDKDVVEVGAANRQWIAGVERNPPLAHTLEIEPLVGRRRTRLVSRSIECDVRAENGGAVLFGINESPVDLTAVRELHLNSGRSISHDIDRITASELDLSLGVSTDGVGTYRHVMECRSP